MASSTLSCTICVDDFENSSDLCSTVCGHVFHFSCLQQWQERSNTCPLCNQSNPQPHRLFLDLPAADKSKTVNEDCNEDALIIKGIQEHLMTTNLSAIILNLAHVMKLSIRQSDIRYVTRNDNTLHVAFYSARHKDMFMENKFKLKADRQTSGVVIHELLDEETKELFHHAHKLKTFGYKIIFVKNKKIYAKKDQEDTPINICSKSQIDSLCGKAQNSTPSELANTAAKRTRSTVKSARSRNTAKLQFSRLPNTASNHRSTVGPARAYNAATSPASQSASTGANPTRRRTVASARPYNAATSSHLENTAVNRTNRSTVSSAPPANAVTVPASQLANTAASRTIRSTVASAPPYNAVFDRDSADLIRRIMMEDYIADSLPSDAIYVHGEINLANRRESNRLPQGFVEQGQDATWRRLFDNQSNNSPQTKSFKKSVVSLFQSIVKKFK